MESKRIECIGGPLDGTWIKVRDRIKIIHAPIQHGLFVFSAVYCITANKAMYISTVKPEFECPTTHLNTSGS